jgi:hypothetical protein
MLAIDDKRADNQTFVFGEHKVIEDTLNRIAGALESISASLALATARGLTFDLPDQSTPRQKPGPGRPRKYPRPDDAPNTVAAPVAADQPVESEVSIAGNDRGGAPSDGFQPPDVVVQPTADERVAGTTPAVEDVTPEPAPAKTVGEDDIREAMINLRRVKAREGVLEVLAQFGVKGVGELEPASFPDVIRAVEVALA